MKRAILFLLLSTLCITAYAQTLSVDAGPDIGLCGFNAPCEVINPVVASGQGPFSYSWSPSAGLSNASILNPCARPQVTTVYTLTVTDGNGNMASDTMTVIVWPTPTADAGIDRDICLGDSVILDGQASGDSTSSFYSYDWSPSSSLNDPTLEDPLASPNMNTTYTLVVFSSHGCPSFPDSVNVFLNPTPIADAGMDQAICTGDSVQLQGSFSFGGGPQGDPNLVSYAWSPAGTLNDTTLANPWAMPDSSGFYYLEVSHTICSTLDSVLITLLPATGIQNVGGVLIAVGATGAGTYQWYQDSILMPGETNPFLFIPQSGVYYFTASEGGCSFSSDTVFIRVLGSPSPENSPGVVLHPNPGQQELFLDQLKPEWKDLNVSLMDLWGREVSRQAYPTASQVELSAQVEGLPKGVYLLTLQNGEEVVEVWKWVKQ